MNIRNCQRFAQSIGLGNDFFEFYAKSIGNKAKINKGTISKVSAQQRKQPTKCKGNIQDGENI